jgi:hypothetical protein
MAPWSAQAAPASTKLTNKLVTGEEHAVSCLTTHLCVLTGYNSFGTGDVIAVKNGVPGRTSTVRHSSGLGDTSCPSASGCVAIADNSSGNPEFVNINSSGVATSEKVVKATPGDAITLISCTRLTSCEVAGEDIFTDPISLIAGTWNGKKLSLKSVAGPKNSSSTAFYGLSCAGGTCDAVGYSLTATATTGFSLTAKGDKLGKLHTASGDALQGVSCVSKSRCYADGDLAFKAGLVVTISNGAIGSRRTAKADLSGIACSGTACTASGEQLVGSADEGVLVSVRSGKITSSQGVSASGGFDSVARLGGFFAAAGASHGSTKDPSEVTTG